MTKPIKTEADYREYARLGQKLGVPTFEAFLEMEVTDGRGKTIHQHRQRSQSWVRNAYNLLFCTMAAYPGQLSEYGPVDWGLGIKTSYPTGTQTYGWDSSYMKIASIGKCNVSGQSAVVVGHTSGSYGYKAAGGETGSGILVGSGTTPETFDDWLLTEKIANGTGAGQLMYAEMQLPVLQSLGLTLKAPWIRYFNNNSGGAVAVKEVGLMAAGTTAGMSGGYTAYPWLMARDVLASTISVPDTGQLKVTYVIQVTYPA